jgi:hypothetical protein
MIAGFLEVEFDPGADLTGNWMPAGGSGWEATINQNVTVDIVGAELQSDDPSGLADLWSRVLGVPVEQQHDLPVVKLNNAVLRFTEAIDGRGPGLGGVDLTVANRHAILAEATARGYVVNEDRVDVCGTRFHLSDV